VRWWGEMILERRMLDRQTVSNDTICVFVMPDSTGSHHRPAIGTYYSIDGFSSLADLIAFLARSFSLRIRCCLGQVQLQPLIPLSPFFNSLSGIPQPNIIAYRNIMAGKKRAAPELGRAAKVRYQRSPTTCSNVLIFMPETEVYLTRHVPDVLRTHQPTHSN
jgi:hypothetical protein